jgi:hypothetical protein
MPMTAVKKLPKVRKAQPQKQQQDPPARERPVDDKWPERDALSFTRILVFHGGVVTEEDELAARYIQEARAMRRKYLEGAGTKVQQPELFSKWAKEEGSLDFSFGPDGVVELFYAKQKM